MGHFFEFDYNKLRGHPLKRREFRTEFRGQDRIPGTQNSGDTIRNKRGKSRIKSYEYWPTSEVKTITNNLDTAKTQYFHYDDLGRLDSAEGLYGTRTYGYDLQGNRQTLNAPGGSATYQYTSGTNRLERTTGAINKYQSYDANGRVFSLGWLVFPNFYKNDQISFVFIGNNRPIARYSYNYQKQRVEKYTGGLNTFYHYDKDGHLIEETDRYGTPITTYIRLAGEPLAQVNHDGAIYYYHNDHLGTPQLLSDVSGSTAWAADYLPFGDASISVESVTNNLRFAGQYYDWETGRYLSADPIGLDGGMNLYAYVQNDPVNAVDPWGLLTFGFGAYFGGGAEVLYSSTTCCENSKEYKIRLITVCGGAGISAKANVSTKPFAKSSVISVRNNCPKTGYYVKHSTSFGPKGVSLRAGSQSNASIFVRWRPSIGTKWTFCSDTVLSKRSTGNCCSN